MLENSLSSNVIRIINLRDIKMFKLFSKSRVFNEFGVNKNFFLVYTNYSFLD